MVTATSLVGMVDPDLGWIDEQVEGERFYDVELEWIFATDWMVLAHEHELPGPGDYVTASIGEDPVVVIRQDDGTINAFLNSCRHRGFRICGGASGHINRFVCEHRAWTYERSGELVEIAGRPAVPLVGEGWDLVAVTHIDIAGGWVLASWADDHHDDRQRRAVAAAISPLLPAGDVQRSVVHATPSSHASSVMQGGPTSMRIAGASSIAPSMPASASTGSSQPPSAAARVAANRRAEQRARGAEKVGVMEKAPRGPGYYTPPVRCACG